MHRVQLFTPAGELVAEVGVPHMPVWPVIQYGDRVFSMQNGRYVETPVYQATVLGHPVGA